jgi:heavy metal sensor kinase
MGIARWTTGLRRILPGRSTENLFLSEAMPSGGEIALNAPASPPHEATPRPRNKLRPRSLRAQLGLWHAGLLALTLLLLAGFTYVLLREFLYRSADAALKQYAENTAAKIAATLYQYETMHPGTPFGLEVERNFLENEELQTWGRYVQVINTHGLPVAFSDALRTRQLPRLDDALQLGLSGDVTFRTQNKLGEYPVRIVTVPVLMGNRIPYLVQVGASVEGVDIALQRASMILLILTPSVFLIALGGGWWLVGRALQPVDEMTRTALSIESKHLDMRLVPPRTDNEIGRLASALNEMIARLDRSFKQMERFSSDASHELKTPLTSIRGEAEVALMSDLTPEEYRKTFQSIIEETERLTSIVNNLLLLARADANQVRLRQDLLWLDEVAMHAYEPMERLARRKHITLEIEAMEETPILGDALWLGQLISNLLQNAINYTPEGGQVFLAVVQETQETVALRVRDTGPGIPAEHLPHIFDRFYRVDSGRSRDQGGSGLGLNIARWIAESHGGAISVASALNEGTTFVVRLPASQKARETKVH